MRAFASIAGQPRAVAALETLAGSERFHPSLIFHGPAGVGKLPAALALARAFLCSSTDEKPCGRCGACRRIDEHALVHPDVRIVVPETLAAFEKGGETAEGLAGLDPQEMQAEALAHPSWGILIDRIRQSIGFLQRGPAEGPKSFLIVEQAQRLPVEAGNALLKTLEEPPAHAVLILSTTSYHALLPTLRSRCQAIPFQLVPRDAIADALVRRGGIEAEEALLRAGLASGRIGSALDLDLEGFRGRREILLGILQMLLERGDPGLAVARAEEIARGGEQAEADLEVLFGLLRDLTVLAAVPAAAGSARLVHVDCSPRLAALAPRLAGAGPMMIERLDATLQGLRRKGHRQLLIEHLLLGLVPDTPATPPRGGA